MNDAWPTVEAILHASPEDACARHRVLRELLTEEYQWCGPSATRRAVRESERLALRATLRAERACADIPAPYRDRAVEATRPRYAGPGDPLAALEERMALYQRHAHLYHLSAIWCGVWDRVLWMPSFSHSGDPAEQAEIERVTAARRAETGILADGARYAREVAEREAAERARRTPTPGQPFVVDGVARCGTTVERVEGDIVWVRIIHCGEIRSYDHRGRRITRGAADLGL